jgi:spermidine synthase
MSRKAEVELAPATVSEADGVRYLHLGTPWVQGAMRLKQPNAIELEYVQRMMVWMLLRPAASVAAGHAVQLGLGAAAITRFCHRVMKMRTTAVELNPDVIGVCRAFFRLPDDGPRLAVLQQDAADYAAAAERAGSVDVLCVDLYDHDAAAPVLDSAGFYRDCARLLADDGVMTVNLFGRDASFERSAARIVAAFPHGSVLSLRPTREGNTIVAALKHGPLPDREELSARAQQVETRYGLPARKWLRMMRALPEDA